LGEARALSRLAALVRDPERAAALLEEAASAYDRAGRHDDALVALAKVIELRPDNEDAYQRLHDTIAADPDAAGHAEMFDNLLSPRLAAADRGPLERAGVP